MEAIETKLAGEAAPSGKVVPAVGRFSGYLASYQPDVGPSVVAGKVDVIRPGAFDRTLRDHRARNSRAIRMYWQHRELIGGFPIDTVREIPGRGLFGVGEVNLNTQLGREAWSFLKLGVIRDLSIGYTATRTHIEGDFRVLDEIVLWEASLVDEPQNRGAVVTEVKLDGSAIEFSPGPATLEGAAASMSTLLADLRGMSAELRDGREWSSPSGTGGSATLEAILADLRGAKEDLREQREAAAAPSCWSSSAGFDRQAAAAILADLRGAKDDLRAGRQRESSRAAIAARSSERANLLARLAGLETRLRIQAA